MIEMPAPTPTNPKARKLLNALLADPDGRAYFHERVAKKALESTNAMRVTARYDLWKTLALYTFIAALVMLSMASDPWDGDEIRNIVLIAIGGGTADALRRKLMRR